MFHGLDNRYLYSAYQLSCTFADSAGDQLSCTGTGFWVPNKHSKLILVTNRHVLDIEYADPKYAGFTLSKLIVTGKPTDASTGQPDVDQRWVLDHSRIKYSNIAQNDIACLVDPSVATIDGSSNPTVEYWIGRDLIATKEDFESQIGVCDFVAFPGFPEWHDKRQHRPILRTGAVSSDPRYDYSWSSDYEGECIAYEAFSYGGSSGSPVFAVQKGPKPGPGISFPGFRDLKLIGINAGHLPAAMDTHSGISYMYKASAILDIVDAE